MIDGIRFVTLYVADQRRSADPAVEPWGSYIQVTDPDGYSVFISQSDG